MLPPESVGILFVGSVKIFFNCLQNTIRILRLLSNHFHLNKEKENCYANLNHVKDLCCTFKLIKETVPRVNNTNSYER